MTARVPRDAAPFLRAVLQGADTEWPALETPVPRRLVSAIVQHGIAPLMHDAVKQHRIDGVPPETAAELEGAYTSGAVLGAIWSAERSRVTSHLRESGITPIALKGASLLGTAYENVALRPMADLDFLVAADELDSACQALFAIGYSGELVAGDEFGHHRKLTRVGPGGLELAVEIHRRWLASPPYDQSIDMRAVIGRSLPIAADEGNPAVLDAVDQLLHLCGHLVLQHPGSERLIWVSDVHRVASVLIDGNSWQIAVERSREMMLQQPLIDGLELASSWFGTDVPEGALRSLCDPGPTAEELDAYERLRLRAPVGQEGARLLADVQGIRGWRERARFALAHLLPSPAYMRQWHGLDDNRELPIYYARRALSGARHIVARRRPKSRAAILERPDRWMVDP